MTSKSITIGCIMIFFTSLNNEVTSQYNTEDVQRDINGEEKGIANVEETYLSVGNPRSSLESKEEFSIADEDLKNKKKSTREKMNKRRHNIMQKMWKPKLMKKKTPPKHLQKTRKIHQQQVMMNRKEAKKNFPQMTKLLQKEQKSTKFPRKTRISKEQD